MCGINGFTFSDEPALRRMHSATRHRGPDGDGFFVASQVSLAHNRLSIIDLSPGGAQPMKTKDGRYTIVFNGEIYNYRELKIELEKRGVAFRSASDTEVLLEAFAAWGPDCLPKLNGIFAFAIWDAEKETLTLVRDQMGVKPLYYAWDGGRLFFSSEIKGILAHPAISREIDPDSLNLYFRFLYVPGPRTMFRAVKKLQPGHLATVSRGSLTIRRWWKVQEGPHVTNREEARKEVRRLVLDSVRMQLVSDRPLGVFLSGGVDSTAVLAAMRQCETGTIKTFSVGYEATQEAEKYNADMNIAARTAAHFGTEHHALTISGKDVAACFLDVVRHMDEPISNHVQPSTYLLAKYAKPAITVALGGDGGDELFGGYDRYWYSAMTDRIQRLPKMFRHRAVLHLAARIAGHASLAEKAALPQGAARFLGYEGQKDLRVQHLVQASLRSQAAVQDVVEPLFSEHWKDFTNQFMAADAEMWLPDESLMRSDKLTMAHGLEERVPLLDPRLVAYAFRIPSKWKLGSRSLGKKILRDAVGDLLPAFVLEEKKRGFFSPAAKWLRSDLLPLARELLSDGFAEGSSAFIDLAAAREMLENHVEKRQYGLTGVWAAMTFQAWYHAFMRE